MTWQDARKDASRLADEISERHSSSEVIRLIEFDSADTYKLLHGPSDPPSWLYHLQIIRATARLLYPRGFKVRRIVVKRDEYMNWLRTSGREHSPEALNEYAATRP
jgi:hypothetical protein